MKKIILFYINMLCYGGAERVISNLANQFAGDGYRVIFVTSYPNPDQEEYCLKKDITRIYLADSKKGSFLRRNAEYITALRKVIRQYRPALAVSFMPEPNFRNIIANTGLHTKTVISVRNDPNIEYRGMLYRMLAKTLYQRADGIVFQTADAREYFEETIKKKSRIIYNSVAPEFYQVKQYEDKKDIVTVGSFKRQKNHKLLIKAFAGISGQIADNLVIYGDGPNRHELERYIKTLGMENRVLLKGNAADIQNEIIRYKLFVLSSDYEGMPNALMEAMAAGMCCIASDCPCGGPRELFGGREEYLFVTGSVRQLREKLLRYSTNESLRNENARYMKNRAQNFESSVIYREWKGYFDSLGGSWD